MTELDQSFPSLIDKLQEVENQSEHVSVPANMSSNLQRIKDLIEKTRDMANRVSDLRKTGDVASTLLYSIIFHLCVLGQRTNLFLWEILH